MVWRTDVVKVNPTPKAAKRRPNPMVLCSWGESVGRNGVEVSYRAYEGCV